MRIHNLPHTRSINITKLTHIANVTRYLISPKVRILKNLSVDLNKYCSWLREKIFGDLCEPLIHCLNRDSHLQRYQCVHQIVCNVKQQYFWLLIRIIKPSFPFFDSSLHPPILSPIQKTFLPSISTKLTWCILFSRYESTLVKMHKLVQYQK